MTDAPTTAPLDLDELARLEKAATPPPWSDAHGELVHDWDSEGYVKLALSPCQNSPAKSARRKHWDADRAYIAALRNAAPALFAAARERDELREILADQEEVANSVIDGLTADRDELRYQIDELRKDRDDAREYGAQARIRENAAEDRRIHDTDKLSNELASARALLVKAGEAVAEAHRFVSKERESRASAFVLGDEYLDEADRCLSVLDTALAEIRLATQTEAGQQETGE